MLYLTLFLTAFLAATLLPASSEALLAGLILQGDALFWGLIVAATAGNTLGSVFNWWLGKYLERYRDRRWFPVSATALASAQQRFQRYGKWSLLLSWVPVIGDPLTVVAGVLRVPLRTFLLWVTLAKAGRYLAIGLPLYWHLL